MLLPARIPIEPVRAIALLAMGREIESLSAVALEILLETLYKLITSYETQLYLHIIHLFGLAIRASPSGPIQGACFWHG